MTVISISLDDPYVVLPYTRLPGSTSPTPVPSSPTRSHSVSSSSSSPSSPSSATPTTVPSTPLISSPSTIDPSSPTPQDGPISPIDPILSRSSTLSNMSLATMSSSVTLPSSVASPISLSARSSIDQSRPSLLGQSSSVVTVSAVTAHLQNNHININNHNNNNNNNSNVDDSSTNNNAPCSVLRGTVTLTLNKPTKITSLALNLNGSTHIAFLGAGKRSHYSRHHLRHQTFLMEPRPHSDHYTTLQKGTFTFPFSISLPSTLPVTVTTPQGGTVYRLVAVLNLYRTSGIMSFLTNGSTVTSSKVVQIFRKSCPDGPSFGGTGEGDEMTPDSVSFKWVNHLDATVILPYVQLPPESRTDLKLRIRVLRPGLTVKYFQAGLWERSVFRVQSTQSPFEFKVVGAKNRPVSFQRCDAGWSLPTENFSPQAADEGPHTFEKVVVFTVPKVNKTAEELWTNRNLNASTRIDPQPIEVLKEEENFKDSEWGDVQIEIQHFIRYSVVVLGSIDKLTGKISKEPVESVIGDMPVVIRGFAGSSDIDGTGLPSYLGSFSTARVSFEEADDILGNNHNGGLDQDGNPIDGYENDDALMALMGLRGTRTPPSYEDSMSRPSIDWSISDLQMVPPIDNNTP